MTTNYRHSGQRMPVVSASAAIASGALVVQEGFFGVAHTAALTGASLNLGISGVWDLPVPASTVKGDTLYVTSLADSAAPTVTRTASGNFKIGVACSDRDTAGRALVLFTDQKPAASA